MAQPSAYEQYLLELINRGRLDPAAEAQRYATDLNEGLAADTISTAAKQPLAFNLLLDDGARAHSQWMLDNDVFSHTGAGGSSPGDRMKAAGYAFSGAWAWGENIAWAGTTGSVDLLRYVAQEHRSLFLSEHHRENTMNDAFQEIGLGVLQGQFTLNGTAYNSVMTTENFAKSGERQFLTGVAFFDKDGDAFYTPGEGISGVRFAARTADGTVHSTTSMDAGGYQEALPTGNYIVTISGGGLPANLQLALTMETANVKLDLVGQAAVQSSASLSLGAHLQDAALLGISDLSVTGNSLNNILTGNNGNNDLRGNGGYDQLFGGDGNDKLNGGPGGDVLNGGNGRDQLVGGDGNDWLVGGIGADRLSGGAGNDTFVVSAGASCRAWGIDWIAEFVAGADRFDVSAANLAAGLTHKTISAADSFDQMFAALGAPAANAMMDIDIASGAKAGHYVFLNDGNSAFSNTADSLIQVSKVTGLLSLSDFV